MSNVDTEFISTHALTEGDYGAGILCGVSNISTHALTEGDLENGQ